MITTAHAIMSLRPNAEWTMTDDDVEGIVWHSEGVEPLTTSEVEAEVIRLQQEEENRVQQEIQARNDAIAHAKSLGFTDEMIAVMYPNLMS